MTGLPASADTAAITASIQAALGGDAMPAGISPGAVAVAVRRAVLGASDWRDHDWQLVREGPQDPALHMAIDEVLLREVACRAPPADAADLGVVGARRGHRQLPVAAQRGRPGQARRLGITVVRRISGGGAMFIEPGNTITYSLYAPESLVAGMSFADSYAFLDDWVIEALTEDLGLGRLVPAAQRHHLRPGQDRRRRAEAAGVAPCCTT